MARLLADHGLPPATFHVRLAGFEVDFLVDGTPVVLEWTAGTITAAHASSSSGIGSAI